MSRIRKATAHTISVLPHARLRAAGYRLLMGYEIGSDARIGLGVVIAVDHFYCGANVAIRRGTRFMGPVTIRLGDNTFVGRWNVFECGEAAADPAFAHMNYTRTFETGQNCLINESHLFDLLGRISIGDGTWIAGFGSQFLTHGASVMKRDIHIGSGCFVGSAVRFAPGSGVGDRVMVAMGAVVTKVLPENDAVVGGLPARFIRTRDIADTYAFSRDW